MKSQAFQWLFYIALIEIILLGCLYSVASAESFTGTESFESYSVGSLNGGSGGTGWSGNWSNGTVYSSPVQAGTRSAGDSGQSAALQRYWTAAEQGSMIIYVRNYSSSDAATIYVQSGGTSHIILTPCYTGGVWRYHMDGSYQTSGTCAADTWYKVEIQWDDANQNDKWRFRVDDGSWVGWGTIANSGSYSTLDNLKIWSAQSGATYIDSINYSTEEPPAATSTTATSSPLEVFLLWNELNAGIYVMAFFFLSIFVWAMRGIVSIL